jgi:hypothetical protein
MSHLRLKKNMGVVSVNNSSNTPLGAGGVFTGTTDDMLHEAVAIVTVHPDQDSAVDGLSVEFSDDAAAWHVTDVFTIQGGSVKTFTFQPVMRYIRIVYTNGAVPQAHLHLSTQFRTTMVKPSSHRVEESISGVDDAELQQRQARQRRGPQHRLRRHREPRWLPEAPGRGAGGGLRRAFRVRPREPALQRDHGERRDDHASAE